MFWYEIVLMPFRVLSWPVAALLPILATVLSPATYILQYSLAPVILLLSLIPSIEVSNDRLHLLTPY
jgi:hypothetical protein